MLDDQVDRGTVHSFSKCINFLYLYRIPAPISQAHQGLQPWIGGDGGRDHERQPFKVQVSRSWPPCHGHQPFWTQDPPAHGQSPHHNRGTAGRFCSNKIIHLLLLYVKFNLYYFQLCVTEFSLRVSLSRSHSIHAFMFYLRLQKHNYFRSMAAAQQSEWQRVCSCAL